MQVENIVNATYFHFSVCKSLNPDTYVTRYFRRLILIMILHIYTFILYYIIILFINFYIGILDSLLLIHLLLSTYAK